MRISFKRIIVGGLAVLLVAALFLQPGCSSSPAPAGPPIPQAEVPVPVSLKFVEPALLRVGVISFLAPEITASLSKAVGDIYAAEILFGFEVASRIDANYTTVALSGIGEIEVPFDVAITSFHETVDFALEPRFLSGPKDIKIDFADFDFDNDGNTEGCSGNATPYQTQAELLANDPATAQPICARMWVDDQRYVAWVFDQFYVDPTIANVAGVNVGAGKFKAYVPIGEPMSIAYVYDHVDPENKSTEQFVKVEFTEPVGTDDNETWHSLFTQNGPDADAIIGMNMSDVYDREDLENNIAGMRSVGQYVLRANDTPPFADVLSASFDYEDQNYPFLLTDFTDQCIQIADGLSVEQTRCEDLGIRIFDAPFIRPLEASDIAIPNDFAATPPSPPF